MPAKSIRELPRSKRNYTFALTPLADAMFQLLIFFMLSSGLAPYSLLTIQSGTGNAAAGGTETPTQAPDALLDAAIWSIESGTIVASGQRFGFDLLPQLTEALIAADTPRVLLIARPEAQVQDLVHVLEALSAAGVDSVQIASTVSG